MNAEHRKPHFELRHLRAFAEVVRHGGFSRAAESLHLTQSTVSKVVSQLEGEVGAPLLQRNRGGIQLTRTGELVFRRAKAMLAQRDLLQHELQTITQPQQGSLRLGFSRLETSTFFGRPLAEFRRCHPEVELTVVTDSDSQLTRRLLRGELDCAGLICARHADLEVLELQREPMMALVPRNHALARQSDIALADLDGEPLVLSEDKCPLNELVLGTFDRVGITTQVAIHTSQVGLLHELVAERLGVGFLPRVLALRRQHPEVVPLRVRDFDHQWTFNLAWPRESRLSAVARAWLAVVRASWSPPGLAWATD